MGQALLECCWAAEEGTAGEGAAGMLLRMLLLLLYWEVAPVARAAGVLLGTAGPPPAAGEAVQAVQRCFDPLLGAAGPAKRLPVDPMLL